MLEIQTIRTSRLHELKIAEEHEVVTVMPALDMDLARRAATVMALRADCGGLLIVAEDDLRLGFIMTANLIYARTKSDYFAYVAQDAFAGQFWLKAGLDALKQRNAGLLAFNDGRFFGTLAVFGLVRRSWIKSVYGNFLFYPGYKSHFADTELSAIALAASQMAFSPNAILMEVDYEKHLHPNNPDDEALYHSREREGFDGRIPPPRA